MKRAPLTLTSLLAMVLLAVGASLAVADHRASGRLAKGIPVGGVPVGGLTEAEAVAKLERTIGSAAQRPVRVVAAHERFKLGARRAGVEVDLAGTVHAAYEQGRTGSWPARAWRSLRGGKVRHDQPVEIAVDRRKVDAFVRAVARDVARDPVDAKVVMTVEKVGAEKEVPGRRLVRTDDLAQRIQTTFATAAEQRRLRGRVGVIAPKVTAKSIWKDQPTTVTVSLAERTVRVFDRGDLTKSYTVAVGAPEVPDPAGRVHGPVQAGQSGVERPPVRLGRRPGRHGDPRRRRRQPARGALDRLQRLGRLPRHGDDQLAGRRGVARLRAHEPERRDRSLRPRRGRDPGARGRGLPRIASNHRRRAAYSLAPGNVRKVP